MDSNSKIMICGDTVPDRRAEDPFIAGDMDAIYGDILHDLMQADIVILNLESPLIKKKSPISKTGPILGVTEKCVEGLKVADVLNLANNHIMDHGAAGLFNTIDVCHKSGLDYVGVGKDIDEAQKILFKDIGGLRLAIMSMAQHEFSIAADRTSGANPLDIQRFVRCVRRNRKEYDFLIVLLHAGNEYYQYPSPRLRDVCHFIIEEGAGAVICQHSHRIGCYEEYMKGHIVYGQGNFVFDRYPEHGNLWYEGILIEIALHENNRSSIRFIPFEQYNQISGVKRMSDSKARQLLDRFNERSNNLTIDGFVEQKWEEFCNSEENDYLSLLLLPQNRFVDYLNKKYRIGKRLYSRKRFEYLLNIIRCESHREVLEQILNKKIDNDHH